MNEYCVVNPIFGPVKENLIQWSIRLARWAVKVTIRIALITAAALLGSLFLTFVQTTF